MTTIDYMYDQNSDQCYSMENYLLNSSFLLGNNGQQDPLPAANSSSSISNSTCSSNNSCIDDFDYSSQSLSSDIFTPTVTVVYDKCLPSSYSIEDENMLGYFFLPLSTPAICPDMPSEPVIKLEFDDTYYLGQQLLLQAQEQAFFDSQYSKQQFPSSPESMFSVSTLSFSSQREMAVVEDQRPKVQSQSQPHPEDLNSRKTDKMPRQKAFPCSFCKRSFARKYDAARHKRIHTGSKPYSCPCCQKSFARSDARVRHFRTEFSCREGPNKVEQGRHRHQHQRYTTPTSSNLCHF